MILLTYRVACISVIIIAGSVDTAKAESLWSIFRSTDPADSVVYIRTRWDIEILTNHFISKF